MLIVPGSMTQKWLKRRNSFSVPLDRPFWVSIHKFIDSKMHFFMLCFNICEIGMCLSIDVCQVAVIIELTSSGCGKFGHSYSYCPHFSWVIYLVDTAWVEFNYCYSVLNGTSLYDMALRQKVCVYVHTHVHAYMYRKAQKRQWDVNLSMSEANIHC